MYKFSLGKKELSFSLIFSKLGSKETHSESWRGPKGPVPAAHPGAVHRLSWLSSRDNRALGSCVERLAKLAILEENEVIFHRLEQKIQSTDLHRAICTEVHGDIQFIIRESTDNRVDEFDPAICEIVFVCHAVHCLLSRHEFELPVR